MKRWFDKNKFRIGNSVKFLQSGDDFFSEVYSIIYSAKYFIHIQLYIFVDDETGKYIISLLKEAASRGVKIYIVVDGYGSSGLSTHTISDLKKSGIQIKIFSPIHTKFRLRIGRRLHHKIILADNKIALVGGINFSNNYKGTITKTAWLDFASKLEGRVCNDILQVCLNVWKRKVKRNFLNEFHHVLHSENKNENLKVRLLQNDFVRRNIEISRFYRQNIKKSKKSLLIIASYFLPGNRMRMLLRKASQRGVKIKLVLSKESDVGLMKHATNYLYPFLLRNNIEIYEWKPSVMHGKMMTVDGEVTTIGSYNLNTLSDYGSIELNVCVDDKNFTRNTEMQIEKLMQNNCAHLQNDDYLKQHFWWNQLINWVSYQLMRTSLKLLFLFMRK